MGIGISYARVGESVGEKRVELEISRETEQLLERVRKD